MSNGNLQPELNDELLSAYLDGELAPEERAAVEARLASDSAAEKMLHELRSVSQSVQRLPLAAVGRDLSADILRRIEARKPTPASDGSGATSASSSPTKPAHFQSRRPWIWASLVVAAGLMIMVVQQGTENGKVAPVFTQSNRAKDPKEVKRELGEPRDGSRLADESGRQPMPAAAAADPSNIASNDALPPHMDSVDFGAAPTPATPTAVPPSSVELYAGTPGSVSSSSELGGDRSSTDKAAAKEIAALGQRLEKTAPGPALSDVATDAEIRSGKFVSRDRPSPAPMPAPAAEGAPLAVNTAPAPVQTPEKLSEPGALQPGFRGGGGGRNEAATSSPVAAPAPNVAGFGMGGAKVAYSDPNRGNEKEARRPRVVVHLVAKADSFEKRSIDKILASHGVVMNEVSQPLALVDGKAVEESNGKPAKKPADTEDLHKSTTDGASFGRAFLGKEPTVDLVLVEAPAGTIASCLAELKDDATNFVSLEVDEPAAGKTDAAKNPARSAGETDKKLEADLRKFNRGSVPEQQKHYYDYFTDFDSDAKLKFEGRTQGEPPFGGIAESTTSGDAKKTAEATRGRASEGKVRRFAATESSEGEKLKAETSPKAGAAGAATDGGESARRAGTVLQYRRAVTGSNQLSHEAELDNVAVLFVISPEVVPTASPVTEKASK